MKVQLVAECKLPQYGVGDAVLPASFSVGLELVFILAAVHVISRPLRRLAAKHMLANGARGLSFEPRLHTMTVELIVTRKPPQDVGGQVVSQAD
jgi:hypothetical protein